VKLMTLIL